MRDGLPGRATHSGFRKMLSTLLNRVMPGAAGATVDHDELVRLIETKAVTVVDVREPAEYAHGHIAGALNVPLSRFDPSLVPAGKPIILYCASGARSSHAQAMMMGAGRDDVRNYRPGFGIWAMQGGKVARG